MSLGYFATAEEAALRIARSPEAQAAAVAVAAKALASEEAQQAQAEKLLLTLLLTSFESQRLEMCKRARDAD